MLKTWMASAAAALAVLLLVGSVGTAEAKRRRRLERRRRQVLTAARSRWRPNSTAARSTAAGRSSTAARSTAAAPKYPKYYGGNFHKGHKHARYHKYRFVGVPLAYYGYSNYAYGDNSCYWLRRRALDSGSSYWWNRYYACIDGYDLLTAAHRTGARVPVRARRRDVSRAGRSARSRAAPARCRA